MFDRFKLFSGEKKETPALIHSDFNIKGDVYDQERNLRWRWNWDELRSSPGRAKYARVIKLAFPFDDPAMLDNCPFMCKIGENIGASKETKYYGFAYTTEEEAHALSEWGQRFPHAKLMTNLEPVSGVTTDESKIEYTKTRDTDNRS
jgi:hypothetical protein